MDHVLRAMLEEFDKGYELLRKMERQKELQLISLTLELLLECVNMPLNLFISNCYFYYYNNC